MSATRVFILVEGRHSDVFFYGELSRPVCDSLGLECEIVRADRVSGSGGKQPYWRCTGILRLRIRLLSVLNRRSLGVCSIWTKMSTTFLDGVCPPLILSTPPVTRSKTLSLCMEA